MLTLQTNNLETFKEMMKKYAPEYVAYKKNMTRCMTHRHVNVTTMFSSSFIVKVDGAGNVLPQDAWIQMAYSEDVQHLGCCCSIDDWENGALLIEPKSKTDLLRILRAYGVPEEELADLKKLKLSKLKEIVDESDETVDLMTLMSKVKGPDRSFDCPGGFTIRVCVSKNSGTLKLKIDPTVYVAYTKKAIQDSLPAGVPFFDDACLYL